MKRNETIFNKDKETENTQKERKNHYQSTKIQNEKLLQIKIKIKICSSSGNFLKSKFEGRLTLLFL